MITFKIFVWTEFCPDYTDGLAFAIAKTENEARQQIIDKRGGAEPYDWGTLEIRPIDKCAYCISGGG